MNLDQYASDMVHCIISLALRRHYKTYINYHRTYTSFDADNGLPVANLIWIISESTISLFCSMFSQYN